MAFLVAVPDPTGHRRPSYTGQTPRKFPGHLIEQDDSSAAFARGAPRRLHRLSVMIHDPDTPEPLAVRMQSLTGRAVLQTVDSKDAAILVQAAARAARKLARY